ncbi:hypothetical protein A6F49_13245 [Enteractinococcus helveticum]|uniref:Uncharacterized protein n=1 Tax=Enteractinococcus helveticum TaxID=1837282 RepID=A0A1B7LX58_9MICC|nr:hypothetical protein A6F49_13245 [Enteractinococcus helveticum]
MALNRPYIQHRMLELSQCPKTIYLKFWRKILRARRGVAVEIPGLPKISMGQKVNALSSHHKQRMNHLPGTIIHSDGID